MGLSEGCPGCRYMRTGEGRQQAHSEACRRRIEGLLKGDLVGSARLAAADERINRALADAVERHATKDPALRGILKRSSVACHPGSEFQKRVAIDTEQAPTPTTSCLIRGVIGVRCTTQRHPWHRPGHRHERRSSSKQRGTQRWRRRDGGGQWRGQQCGTSKPIGARQQKEDHNEKETA